jgi:hypothetical protein
MYFKTNVEMSEKGTKYSWESDFEGDLCSLITSIIKGRFGVKPGQTL